MIKPPYTNRSGTVPGPNYRQCRGITKKGTRCRAAAEYSGLYCAQHRSQSPMENSKIKEYRKEYSEAANAGDFSGMFWAAEKSREEKDNLTICNFGVLGSLLILGIVALLETF